MKIFKLMTIALVAMLGFTACDKDCDHDFIEVDHSKDLVGTWTCLTADYAEALVIKADGSVVSTGVEDGEYWEDVKGTIKTVNNKMTMIFEDNHNFEGRFEMLSGVAFTIYDENGESLTYRYCANDLSDEIVGMWVCNDGPDNIENEIMIRTYRKDGIVAATGIVEVDGTPRWFLNEECKYRIVGDLKFKELPKELAELFNCTHKAEQLIYTPNATALGDIMNTRLLDDNSVEFTATFLRVKQNLNLTGKTYDYSTAYVSNAKGKDEDFTIAGETFNIANITGYDFNELFGSDLFSVEFPNANTIKHKFRPNGQNVEDLTPILTPITVDGNKVILDMGASNPAWRTVEMYMFQDKDDTQLHMFMSTQSCINYLANFAIPALIEEGKLDPTDAAAVEKVFADMEARVESINVSFVLKARE